MKRQFMLFFTLLSLTTAGQSGCNYVVRTNFGFSQDHKDVLDLNPYYHVIQAPPVLLGTKETTGSLHFNVGKKLNSKFTYGVGASYDLVQVETNPEEDIPENYTLSYVNTISKSKSLCPTIFFQYSYTISERISFISDLSFGFDFRKYTNQSNGYIDSPVYPGSASRFEYESEYKTQHLSGHLRPAMRYRILEKAGVEISLGGANFSRKTKDTRNPNTKPSSSEFSIGFRPENWLLGFYWMF